jgi:hypothetical protein
MAVMRSLALAASISLMASFASAQTYPWCAAYTDGDRNCSFESYEQCRMTATPGAGAHCEQNLLYKPAPPEPVTAPEQSAANPTATPVKKPKKRKAQAAPPPAQAAPPKTTQPQ